MKNLNKKQTVAVFAGLGLVTYMLFAGDIMNLVGFSGANNQQQSMNQLQIQDVRAGEGIAAQAGDRLTVHYVGTLPDGRVFDSSRDRGAPFTFTLGAGEVIRGWDEGLIGLQQGGVRMLVIPPEYGYGSNGVGPIPPNATLIFEVELVDVERQ